MGTSDPTLYLHSEAYLAPGAVFASVGPQPSIHGGFSGLARLFLALLRPGFLGGVKRQWTYVPRILFKHCKRLKHVCRLISAADRPDEWKKFGKYVTDGTSKRAIYFYQCLDFFFKQKTAYEILRSDWSSDVCSSDLSILTKIPRIPRGSGNL